MRPVGSAAELERRRRRAVRLAQAGHSLSAAARMAGAAVSAVWQWRESWRRRGEAGLRARPTPGRPPKLTSRQRQRLPKLLALGAPRGRPRARTIDLDLLFFDKEVIRTHALEVPHPRLHERRFVLAPMSELAPALIHPKLNGTISELLAALKSPYRVALARADLLRPPSSKPAMAAR